MEIEKSIYYRNFDKKHIYDPIYDRFWKNHLRTSGGKT